MVSYCSQVLNLYAMLSHAAIFQFEFDVKKRNMIQTAQPFQLTIGLHLLYFIRQKGYGVGNSTFFSRFKVQGTFIIPEWQFVVQPAEKPGRTARTLSFFPPEFMFQLSPVNLIPSKNVQKNYCGCHISESIVLERQSRIGEQSVSFHRVHNFSAASGSNFS